MAITQNLIAKNPDPMDAAEEFIEEKMAENIKNHDPEHWSGGGQEAIEEAMKKERKEESVNTEIRKGKELEEVLEGFEIREQDYSQKIIMRKVDDDASLLLKRKFRHQFKTKNIKPKKNLKKMGGSASYIW